MFLIVSFGGLVDQELGCNATDKKKLVTVQPTSATWYQLNGSPTFHAAPLQHEM